MGALFVLISHCLIWGFFALITFTCGVILASIYKRFTKKNIAKRRWGFLASMLTFLFPVMLFVELCFYNVLKNMDIINDHEEIIINEYYSMNWTDHSACDLLYNDNDIIVVDVIDILALDDKIVAISKVDENYEHLKFRLYEVSANKKECKYLYSANNTQILWNKYEEEHTIDEDEIYSTHTFHWEDGNYYFLVVICLNFLVIVTIIIKLWKPYLTKEKMPKTVDKDK